jgi:hypothetical protein
MNWQHAGHAAAPAERAVLALTDSCRSLTQLILAVLATKLCRI